MIGPVPWVGGKNRLAKRLIALLPSHVTYIEPFCGGSQVFFHKQPSRVEVLNDLDGELVNFLRCCQWHHEELIRSLRYLVVSRHWYGLLKSTDPRNLTDIQRASRFFYIQKTSYGGMVTRQNYHYHVVQAPNYNPARLPHIIEQAHHRLQHVQIESLPYEEILRRYDRVRSFYLVDPPYWGPKLYHFNFTPEHFIHLRDQLAKLKGRFLLTLNDRPEVRQLFAEFYIQPILLAYSAQRRSGRRFPELLITNYELEHGTAESGT